MKRSIIPLAGFCIFMGISGLFRWAPHVRSVDAVGISGSAFTLGIGVMILVFALAGRIKS